MKFKMGIKISMFLQKIVLGFSFSALCLFFVGSLYAENKLVATVDAGQMLGNKQMSSGLAYGGSVRMMGPHLGGSLSVLRTKVDAKNDELKEGTLSIMPISFNLLAKLPVEKLGFEALKISAGGGVSYVAASHEVSSAVENQFSPLPIRYKESIENGMAQQIVLDTQYDFTENISVGLQFTHLFFNSDTHKALILPNGNQITLKRDSVNLDTNFILISLRYQY